MNARFVLLVLALLVAFSLGAGCTQPAQSPAASTPTHAVTQPPTPVATPLPVTTGLVAATASPSPKPTTTPQTTVTTVHISGFAFVPATLTVLPGTQITWVNDDDAPHTVTAVGSNQALFQSQTLRKGDEFQYTFGSVGTVDYICSIHPSMHGKIVVKEGAGIVGA